MNLRFSFFDRVIQDLGYTNIWIYFVPIDSMRKLTTSIIFMSTNQKRPHFEWGED